MRAQGSRHQVDAHAFADTGNCIERARGSFTEYAHRLCEQFKFIQQGHYRCFYCSDIWRSAGQFVQRRFVAYAEGVGCLFGFGQIAGGGDVRAIDEHIRHATHGRDHDDDA